MKQSGFSLIELAVVIVILGILAATAAPKFTGLANDKAANLEAIGGTMRSALQLINSRARIQRQNDDHGVIQINGIDIPLYNGYPSVRGNDSFAKINAQVNAWLHIDAVDRDTARGNRDAAMYFTDKSSPRNQIYIFFTTDYDNKNITFKCHVLYENPESNNPDKPVVSVQTSDC